MRPYLTVEHPVRMAHRGSRLLWPENTLTAFQGAVDLGYVYLETDVRASADHVLYAFHDPTLERCTNGRGAIARWDSRELDRLDAAYHFGAGAGYPLRGGGVRIPRLAELVTAFPAARINIDLKSDDTVSLVAAFVLGRGLEDRVLIGSFSDRRVRAFRRLTKGRVATSAGRGEASAAWAASRVGRGWRSAADALQVPERLRGRTAVDRRLVDAAHAAGKQVHVWTVDEPAAMHRLLDLGVDGIITDRPDVLNDVVAARR